ncbi:MAG TPA: hypothetical protein VKD91_11330 [Pyrinomonadaceae bacterium]|nr:hypothetical protein [Pyrinomonadaceae bacterium]
MEDSRAAQTMIDYLKNQVLRNTKLDIDQDTELVDSGIVDSFALVDVLLKLEEVTRRRIPAGRVSPTDMNTVRQMLVLAERVGKPR